MDHMKQSHFILGDDFNYYAWVQSTNSVHVVLQNTFAAIKVGYG